MNYVEVMEGVKSSRKKKKDETMLEFIQKSDRDEYEELKGLIENGTCRNLWYFTDMRLHRVNIQSLLFFEDYIDRFKVKCFIGTTGVQVLRDTIEQKFQQEQQSLYSQQETRVRRFQSVTGKRRKSESTDLPIHLGGKCRYGYRVNNKLVEIDPKKSKMVKRMYQMRVEGSSTKEIQQWLTVNNVERPRKSTKIWNIRTIDNILQNEGYTGHFKWFDKEIEKEFIIKHPQIISNLLFRKVEKTYEQNKQKSGTNRIHESLLSDYLICECGTKYGGHTHKTVRNVSDDKNKKGSVVNTSTYYCMTKMNNFKTIEKKQCDNSKSLDQKRTNEFILSKIKEVVSNSSILKEETKQKVLSRKQIDSKKLKQEIQELEQRVKYLDSKIHLTDENIGLVMFQELQKKISKTQSKVILKSLREELEELNNDRDKTISEIVNKDSENQWLDWIDEFSRDLELKLKTTRSNVIENLVKDITVYPTFTKNRDKVVKQSGHKLKIKFKLGIVNDSVVYHDEKNKKKGYDIKSGSKILNTDSFQSYNVGGRGKKKGK